MYQSKSKRFIFLTSFEITVVEERAGHAVRGASSIWSSNGDEEVSLVLDQLRGERSLLHLTYNPGCIV